MLNSISTPEDSFSCPLCRKDLGSSKPTYISHLAKHMEGIALATLPPDPEDMSGDESDFGDQPDESVQDAEENHPREHTTSLFRLNTKAAREEGNNPCDHNGIMESPTSWDPGNDPKQNWQRFLGTLASSDKSFKLGRSDLEFENTARVHPLYYNVTPHADGLYHCPWENKPEANCQHKPEKLKCNYEYDRNFFFSPLLPFSSYPCSTLIISFPLANLWTLTLSRIGVRSRLVKNSGSHLPPVFFDMNVWSTPCMDMAINPFSVLMKDVRGV
jgi:hypothetical protein